MKEESFKGFLKIKKQSSKGSCLVQINRRAFVFNIIMSVYNNVDFSELLNTGHEF